VIGLERPDAPDVLRGDRSKDAQALRAQLRKAGTRPPELAAFVYGAEVFDALAAMTGGRCAYCERVIAGAGGYASRTRSAGVTHHRPPWGAVGSDGTASVEHYWWLAYSWDNLLPACSECIRAKGNRFPVDAPERARRGRPLGDERPLLLDPGAEDPEPHLLFQPDGTVVGATPRGGATIEVLALNRASLVAERRDVAAAVLSGRPTIATDGAFQALRRQLSRMPKATARTSQTAMPLTRDHYDLESAAPMRDDEKASYFSSVRWIERVRIRNFRPIRDLTLDFSGSASENGPWRVLLGENGSGKSSILQAIALALIGGGYRRELGIVPEKFLRYGASEGSIEVNLTGSTEPLRVTFDRSATEFTGPEAARVLLLGYGATRLLPRPGASVAPPRTGMTRVDNLFNPFLANTDPSAWLLSLPPATFRDVADGLARLLDLPRQARIVPDPPRRRVEVRQGRDRSTIEALSDGYQSMLVLACDVMSTVLSLWEHVSLAEGIVLIDELGAHLHPRWRMRIVGALRTLLPRVQFAVTTHDPLCLRGVLDGEVTVIRRSPENHVVAITDLPPVQGMRVDQLLTSEHFGLGSTDDPVVTDLWADYYRLSGLRKPRAADRAALADVRRRLDELDELGRTERERLLLSSADAFIAKRRAEGDPVRPEERSKAAAELDADLASLWASHLPTPDGGR
jgi:hypothetical protein